jgi:hypothetical protein
MLVGQGLLAVVRVLVVVKTTQACVAQETHPTACYACHVIFCPTHPSRGMARRFSTRPNTPRLDSSFWPYGELFTPRVAICEHGRWVCRQTSSAAMAVLICKLKMACTHDPARDSQCNLHLHVHMQRRARQNRFTYVFKHRVTEGCCSRASSRSQPKPQPATAGGSQGQAVGGQRTPSDHVWNVSSPLSLSRRRRCGCDDASAAMIATTTTTTTTIIITTNHHHHYHH